MAVSEDFYSTRFYTNRECCDNSFDNLGKGNGYVMYGPNRARAGSVPFRDSKCKTFESGIPARAFVRYDGTVPPVVRNDGFATVTDIYATFAVPAETAHPGDSHRGRTVLPIKSRSMLPPLSEESGAIHEQSTYVGWALYGHAAVRQGDCKIVRDATEDTAAWKLFNLAADPPEQNDPSAKEPDRLKAMLRLWEEYQHKNSVILLD